MSEPYPESLSPAERDDLDWCHEAVQDVSRTFAITIDVLDEPMSSYICVGYLLCRIADTVEDSPRITPETKASLLSLYDDALNPNADTTPADFHSEVETHIPDSPCADWNVVSETRRVFRTYDSMPDDVREATIPPVRELTQGMEMFVSRHADHSGVRVETQEELEEYCYYVAGTVGHLIVNLGYEEPTANADSERYRIAEGFGNFLQIVNIAKDVYDDYHTENNVYLPAEWLSEAGVPTQDAVCDDAHEDAVASVVKQTAEHAHSFSDTAREYLQSLPRVRGNNFEAWAIPYLLALGTLREITAHPEDSLTENSVKISRDEVYAVISELTSEDGVSFAELEAVIAEEPYTF